MNNLTETTVCYFTLNPEHYALLEKLQKKTGKGRKQLMREAIDLALTKGLEPARYTWVDKNHRIISVPLPTEQAEKTKKLWKGKLTPLAVAGLLVLAGESEITQGISPDTTTQDILRLRDDVNRILHNIRPKAPESNTDHKAVKATDSITAAKTVRSTLRQLANELEYFKKGSEAERKKFRELIDPMEVGYITSLIKALFDEEGFQRWILATEFTMGTKDNA